MAKLLISRWPQTTLREKAQKTKKHSIAVLPFVQEVLAGQQVQGARN